MERGTMKEKSEITQQADEKECQRGGVRVDRRELLKLATLAAGAAMSSLLLPSLGHSTTNAALFRDGRRVELKGTYTGKILESLDGGITWKEIADFGPDCPVLRLRSVSTGVQTEIGHKGFRFPLYSADGRQWTT
jgi:hypothetical protein